MEKLEFSQILTLLLIILFFFDGHDWCKSKDVIGSILDLLESSSIKSANNKTMKKKLVYYIEDCIARWFFDILESPKNTKGKI